MAVLAMSPGRFLAVSKVGVQCKVGALHSMVAFWGGTEYNGANRTEEINSQFVLKQRDPLTSYLFCNYSNYHR